MYQSSPVMIPKVPGKISTKKRNGREYIQYETGRNYDPARKYNLVQRKIIGLKIHSLPNMMLPNENYLLYFKGEEKNMDEEQKQTARTYEKQKKQFFMLRDLFDQLYYEFQLQSRRKPDDKVNPYKIQKINNILQPLRELMAGEEYAQYLDLIDETTDDAAGKTYSDVALMLTQYKGSIKRYYNERI